MTQNKDQAMTPVEPLIAHSRTNKFTGRLFVSYELFLSIEADSANEASIMLHEHYLKIYGRSYEAANAHKAIKSIAEHNAMYRADVLPEKPLGVLK